MWDYTDKVKDHFLNPRNVGEVKNPDGIGEVGNIKCGDALRLTFKLDKQKRISEIKFKTFGCGSAIASSSVLTELCKGKTLEEVSQITNKEIAEALGGLPPEKMHCSVMGQEALQEAIDFYKSGGKKADQPVEKGTIVCTCFSVTDTAIEQAIRENNLTTVSEVTNYTKAGGGCGGCKPQIEKILETVNGRKEQTAAYQETKPMTLLEKIDKIRSVFDHDIRPYLQKDGGDCSFVDINENTVKISFQGQCAGCVFSKATQIDFIEKTLKEKVHPDLVVIQE